MLVPKTKRRVVALPVTGKRNVPVPTYTPVACTVTDVAVILVDVPTIVSIPHVDMVRDVVMVRDVAPVAAGPVPSVTVAEIAAISMVNVVRLVPMSCPRVKHGWPPRAEGARHFTWHV